MPIQAACSQNANAAQPSAPSTSVTMVPATLHHPMVLGVKLWAFGHLLATAKLADVVLFGAFLLWAILSYRAARQRDRALGTTYAAGTVGGTLIALVVGVLAWAAFAFWAHAAWIGIAPLGRTL